MEREQQALSHEERQTAALESIRNILMGFVWAVAILAAIGFVAWRFSSL